MYFGNVPELERESPAALVVHSLRLQLMVNFKDATNTRLRLPIEVWITRETYTWAPVNKSGVASVVVDPDDVLPDDNCSDKTMQAP